MPYFATPSPYRCADAGRCNKCFAPLDPDGICRQPHATTSLPPMVEQGAPKCDLQRDPLSWLGKSHVGNLAKGVA
jgi:hypothetical protein